ncbi:MAG: hypothetical protein BJ554DRAFT_7243 [Olpidium bornovanus]|uniref:Uncharacterized protein n=1 Tax=Olpidium bornovanus TaxID=278681 RepID=A0A8H7ZWJ7_9FUNG|nr:MAG: hypothetical protein BJ554DRAFT_7243 [Olpidium bornovanus]
MRLPGSKGGAGQRFRELADSTDDHSRSVREAAHSDSLEVDRPCGPSVRPGIAVHNIRRSAHAGDHRSEADRKQHLSVSLHRSSPLHPWRLPRPNSILLVQRLRRL